MSDNTPQNSQRAPRRRALKLPFDNKGKDIGTWSYDHRIGLCVTLIVYLVVMIAFVSSKIVVGRKPHQQGFYIDLKTLDMMEAERERLEREVKQRQAEQSIDWSSIQNQQSNENALNEQLQDDRGTNTAALNDAAVKTEAQMRANREAYEKGLAEQQALYDATRGSEQGAERQDRRVKGRVTVSFSLKNPVRTSRDLVVPAYMCEGGGEVVIDVVVNQSGEVTSARVRSGGDECMQQWAVKAAEESLFNIDGTAPKRQSGTITYIFIPQ